MNELNFKQEQILNALDANTGKDINDILQALTVARIEISKATLNRELVELINVGLITRTGSARATEYVISRLYNYVRPVDFDAYQEGKPTISNPIRFKPEIFTDLGSVEVFTETELKNLQRLQQEYTNNFSKLSETIKRREYERLTIELSWKSSAMEGNTYTLLETETLLKDGLPAKGRNNLETQMLLNHKEALKFILENLNEFKKIDLKVIEQIHKILAYDLGITTNIRKTLVGITGADYKPLDNVFQITKAMQNFCKLINTKEIFFEKSVLALLFISYIQPFEDGNKRTARLVANAILLANESFPLSFRSVDSTEYKEALLLFYEINNLANFKKLYMQQAEYSVANYFKA